MPFWSTRILAASTLLTLFLISLPTVYGHPDFQVTDATLEVAPRGFVDFPLSVHYHRLLGSLEVVSPAAGTVNILVLDELAFSNYTAKQPANKLYSSGSVNKITLDLPLHCCIRVHTDSNEDYTRYHLVIENVEASVPKTVKLKVDLVHDGMAVILYYGEPLAVAQVGGLLVVISSIWSVISIKRGTVLSAVEKGVGRKTLLLALGSLAILFLAAFSAYGSSRVVELIYGESQLASFSLPIGAVGGAFSVSAILIPWIFAIHVRRKGANVAVRLGSRLMGTVFLILGVDFLLEGIVLQLTYRTALPPVLVLGTVGLLLVLGGSYLITRFRKKAPIASPTPLL